MGAPDSSGAPARVRDVVAALGVDAGLLGALEKEERGEAEGPDVLGRIVIVVDDGVATGTTIIAAVALLKQLQAARIIVARPATSRAWA